MELQVHVRKDPAQDLGEALRAFLFERESRGLSPATVEWYQRRLGVFRDWASEEAASLPPELVGRPCSCHRQHLRKRAGLGLHSR